MSFDIGTMMRACTTSGNTGWGSRCNWLCFNDSTGGVQGTKITGEAVEDADWPWSWWEGLTLAFNARSLIWGTAINNYCINTPISRASGTGFNSTGTSISADGGLHGRADPNSNPTLTAGRSFSYANAYFNGPLHYFDGTGDNTSGGGILLIEQRAVISSSFPNPNILGDLTTTDFRVHVRWCGAVGATGHVCVRRGFSDLSDAAVMEFIGGDGATFQNASAVYVHNSGSDFGITYRLVTPHDPGTTDYSGGPILYSGFQFTHKDVSASDLTTGPLGFAVTPVFVRVGHTLTELASEMYFAGAAAIAELIATCRARARWVVFDFHFLANDANTSANSFKPTDTPCCDARLNAFTGCTWDNTAKTLTKAGIGTGHDTGSVIKITGGTGWTVHEVLVTAVSTNALTLTEIDGNTINITGSADVAVAAEPHGVTGADQSTAEGVVQNLSSLRQLIDAACVIANCPPGDVILLWSAAHAQNTTGGASFETVVQGVCDWVDGSSYTTYSGASRCTVLRTNRLMSTEIMRELILYNGTTMIVDQITAHATAPVIRTTTAHGFVAGTTRVTLHGTDETINGANPKLSSSSLGASATAAPAEWLVTTIPDTTHFTVQMMVAGVMVGTDTTTGAGTKGSVCVQNDQSHLRARGHMMIANIAVNAMLSESGLVDIDFPGGHRRVLRTSRIARVARIG